MAELLLKKLLYTKKETAELLSYSERTIERFIEEGLLKTFQRYSGKQGVRIKAESIIEMIGNKMRNS